MRFGISKLKVPVDPVYTGHFIEKKLHVNMRSC